MDVARLLQVSTYANTSGFEPRARQICGRPPGANVQLIGSNVLASAHS